MSSHADMCIDKLLRKGEVPLQEHLRIAVENGLVREHYKWQVGKQRSESTEKFAARLAQEASVYQFVQVIHNRVRNFVAFGVSGPVITRFGKFSLVPAEVVGGRSGMHYFLFHPNIQRVLSTKELPIFIEEGCMTGRFFNDITCHCREKFEGMLHSCAEEKTGIIISIPQHDGGGWHEYKLATQQLMDDCDLEAEEAISLLYQDKVCADQRSYTEAVLILKAFGFAKRHVFKLASPNPRQIGTFMSLDMKLASPP